MNKRLIIVLLTVFSILLFAPLSHAERVMPRKKGNTAAAEKNWIETKWVEPEWNETSTDTILLRFDNLSGTKGRYLEKRNFIISGKGKPTRGEQTISTEYRVTEAGGNGPSKLRFKWLRLASRGIGSNLMRFLKNSSPMIANYSMFPNGNIASSEGFMSSSSLPVFPEEEVSIGSRWNGESTFAFSPVFPFLLANGKMSYIMEGLAQVDGNQWALISFKGDIDLPPSGIVIRKIIGVKKSKKQLGSLKGAMIDKVAPDMPGGKAGLVKNDIILRYDDKRLSNWSDLKYAISTAQGEGPYELIVRRSGRRQTLSITPEVAIQGLISGTGRVNGRVVFDVTRGVLVRLEIIPLSIRMKLNAKGRNIKQKVVLKAVTELLGVEVSENAVIEAASSAPKPKVVKESKPSEVKKPVEEIAPVAPVAPKVTKEVAPAAPSTPDATKVIKEVAPVATKVTKEIAPVAPVAPKVTKEVAPAAPSTPDATKVIKEVAPVAPKVIKEVAPVAPKVIKEVAPVAPKVTNEVAPAAPATMKAIEAAAPAAPAETKVIEKAAPVVPVAPKVIKEVAPAAPTTPDVTKATKEVVPVAPTAPATMKAIEEVAPVAPVAPKVTKEAAPVAPAEMKAIEEIAPTEEVEPDAL